MFLVKNLYGFTYIMAIILFSLVAKLPQPSHDISSVLGFVNRLVSVPHFSPLYWLNHLLSHTHTSAESEASLSLMLNGPPVPFPLSWTLPPSPLTEASSKNFPLLPLRQRRIYEWKRVFGSGPSTQPCGSPCPHTWMHEVSKSDGLSGRAAPTFRGSWTYERCECDIVMYPFCPPRTKIPWNNPVPLAVSFSSSCFLFSSPADTFRNILLE